LFSIGARPVRWEDPVSEEFHFDAKTQDIEGNVMPLTGEHQWRSYYKKFEEKCVVNTIEVVHEFILSVVAPETFMMINGIARRPQP
jgi:hypothetical protein